MNSGAIKMSRFKTVVPLMIYLEPADRERVKAFAKNEGLNVSQLSREAFQMRMSDSSDLFNSGFNAGLNEAMKIVNNCQGASMMFPSGKSFARVVCDDIEKYLKDKKND
jgi:hypothetical protein